MRPLAVLLLALSFLAMPRRALAHWDALPAAGASAHPAGSAAPPTDEVAPGSPRASVKRFMDLCRAGELAEAATYLDLSDAQKPEGRELARRLKAVLDRQMWGKLESISPKPLGDQSDHLPLGVEEIGVIPTPRGPEPVRLVRRQFPDGPRWIFSRNTVERIDDWFSRLRDRWQQEYLPQRLLRSGPKDLLWWQWIALPVLFAIALAAGAIMGWATRKALGRFVASTKTQVDDAILNRLGAPLTLAWAACAVYLALPALALYPPAEAFIVSLLRAALLLSLLWFLNRCVDVGAARILELPTAKSNPAARSLVPLGSRSLKVALVLMGMLVALSELGVAVGSLVAGLGIGGVAIALAAQKTVENLFGSLSIGVDQPFRVGDWITVDTLSGTVEAIGLRSTRVRTLDRTLVTIPNGKLADMRIESFASRDRSKLACTLSLAQTTKPEAVRKILTEVRALFKQNPKIWPDVTVSLSRVTENSLDVEVLVWFKTINGDEFNALREEALLAMLDIVERAGTRLATPTRTMRVES